MILRNRSKNHDEGVFTVFSFMLSTVYHFMEQIWNLYQDLSLELGKERPHVDFYEIYSGYFEVTDEQQNPWVQCDYNTGSLVD